MYLVNFCLPSQEDEHIPSWFMHVDVHGCVNSSAQVVLSGMLHAVDTLNVKGSACHIEAATKYGIGVPCQFLPARSRR